MERDSPTSKGKNLILYLEGGTCLSISKNIGQPEIPCIEKVKDIYLKRYSSFGRVLFSQNLILSEHATIKDYFLLWGKIKNYPEEIIVICTGTDNLPFLAAYLDLHNNSKKIILTYSQRSISRPTTDIFKNLDYLYANKTEIPKNSYYTLILGTRKNKPTFFSNNILKNHTYKKDCFIELDKLKPGLNYSDSGTLSVRSNPSFPSISINISTPLSLRACQKESKVDDMILLPGLGNTDGYSSRSYFTYTIGPSLHTYSKTRKIVSNNWIRAVVKEYCKRYCSV